MNYVFPNELNVTWTVMIVLYPYITGLVAGAFIVSSLYHVFGRDELRPISRFSLVSAFVFLLFATLPLLIHLGHPERAFNIMITPHFTSAMAGFGYIYSAYLLLVVLEIWFAMRGDFIARSRDRGFAPWICRAILLFNLKDTEATRAADHRITKFLAGIGIPLACLLHGYVGFLFGSIKANPWWSTPLMPIVFLFSAIVSGIALVMLMYQFVSWFTGRPVQMTCLDTIARYLFYAFIIDFSLEMLDLIHRIYESDESFRALDFMVHTRLYTSQVIVQIVVGTLVPLGMLALAQMVRLTDRARQGVYAAAGLLTLVGIFAMRWNVVIGGQLFSKSFLGYTTYKMEFATREGLLPAILLMVLPFVILAVLVRLLPPWKDMDDEPAG